MKNLYVRIFIGIVGALLIFHTVYQFAVREPGREFFGSQLGLEFGRTPEEIELSLRNGGVSKAIRETRDDSWVFVPLYLVLFYSLPAILKSQFPAMENGIFSSSWVARSSPALADWTENHYILRTLSLKGPSPEFIYKYTACSMK